MKKYFIFTLFVMVLTSYAVQTSNVVDTVVVDTRDYNLTVTADNGAATPAAGVHTYSWHSSVPCAAVAETNGWLFTGWSGDATTDHTQTNVTVLMDALTKAVIASYSDDPDGDGLKNTNEWAAGASPWLADTDGDGFDDKLEFDNDGNPTVSDSWRIPYIQDNPETFGLYTSNSVLDVAVGQMLIAVAGGQAQLNIQLESSEDLVSWTNAGEVVEWTLEVDGDKKFFRVRSSK